MTVTILLQAALWIWFLGCTTTYRLGKYTLVEGMGIKSAEFAMLCLYSVGLLLYLSPACGKMDPAGHSEPLVRRGILLPLVFHDLRRVRAEAEGLQ